VATAPSKLISATVYLPGGRVKRYDGKEVAAWGITPTRAAVLMVKNGETYTRYAGFGISFEEELSSIEVAPSPPLGFG
jgi:hypothetical protein